MPPDETQRTACYDGGSWDRALEETMSLQVEHLGDVAVVVPEGMLKGGKETDELKDVLRKLIEDRHKKILLDLEKTTYMTSAPIGLVAAIHASAGGGHLAFFVCNVNERIQKVWASILKLLKPPLDLHPTREDALRALAKLES